MESKNAPAIIAATKPEKLFLSATSYLTTESYSTFLFIINTTRPTISCGVVERCIGLSLMP